MKTTFYNTSITIEAATPQEAYMKLCELLDITGENIGVVAYSTDTFSTTLPDGTESEERSTEEICTECGEDD